MNTKTAQERTETAVRNIMSGDNACGTLVDAAARGDAEYFRRAVRPIVATYEDEANVLRQQRDNALRDVEAKRFALEAVLSNLDIPAGPVRAAVAQAMPGHPLLPGA